MVADTPQPGPDAEREALKMTHAQRHRNELVGTIGETIMDGWDQHPPFPAMPSDVAWEMAREIASRLEEVGVQLETAWSEDEHQRRQSNAETDGKGRRGSARRDRQPHIMGIGQL